MRARQTTLMERFCEKVMPEPNSGCWLWMGTISDFLGGRPGYGRLKYKRKALLAHRVSYELFVGKIPAGLVIDHKCHTPLCVNPNHLEAVTHRENIKRSFTRDGRELPPLTRDNLDKSHCPHGHPYSGENLYVDPSSGGRKCRTCRQRGQMLRKLKRAA